MAIHQGLSVLILFTILAFSAAQPVGKGRSWENECVYLKNAQYDEYFYPVSDPVAADKRRNVATWRDKNSDLHSKTWGGQGTWILKPARSPGYYTIEDVAYKQFLVASDNFVNGQQRRKLFTISRWTPAAVWAIEPTSDASRVRIKNKLYGEYMYAAAGDLAFDKDRRSIFTWVDEKADPAAQWSPDEIDKPIWIIENATC